MTHIQLGEDIFSIRSNWHEIDYLTALAIEELPIPDKLHKLYTSTSEKDWNRLITEQVEEENTIYFKTIIGLLGDIPQDILDKTQHGIDDFYHRYLELYIIDIIKTYPSKQTFSPCNQEWVELNKIKYYFPTSKKIINDTQLLAQETVAPILEALDISSNKMGVSGLLALGAILLREKPGYNEDEVLNRVEIFKQLPMQTLWEVFFCLIRLSRE